MQKWGLGFICPSQRRAAHVALYVNGALFVSVLHMSITPRFNPSLCLESGTFPVACVQGLAARVAVTVFNRQQARSPATRCFECICIETTIRVLDIPTLHMHGFITSNNKWQVFDCCKACRACRKPAAICVSIIQSAACVQVLSGLLRVRYQTRRLFICSNNPFVSGFSDRMHEHMHVLSQQLRSAFLCSQQQIGLSKDCRYTSYELWVLPFSLCLPSHSNTHRLSGATCRFWYPDSLPPPRSST